MAPSSSTAAATKPRKATPSTTHSHPSSSPLFCRNHSPSATATLDLLILILVLISGSFLLTSYFSYLFTSLSLLLSPHLSLPPLAYSLGVISTLLAFYACLSSLSRSRRCHNPTCRGLKKALEFDLQLQTEDCLKNTTTSSVVPTNYKYGTSTTARLDFDKLPWKGGTETNPDYECLRAELRKMAPPNGRAVLLFRAKCGCPVAKLVGWGPKKGRKHKKALSSTAINGDHR